MTVRENQETLLGYFNELLKDSENPGSSSSPNPTPSKSTEIDNNHSPLRDEISDSKDPQLPPVAIKNQEKPIIAKTAKITSRSNQSPVTENNSKPSKAAGLTNLTGENDPADDNKAPLQTTESAIKEISPTAEVKNTVTTDKPVADGIYEQHKQRLEKMLQSVAPLEVNPLQETTPAFEALKQEVIADVDSDAEISTDVLDYQAPPPLGSEWLENGRPHWAQNRFDILILEVNGLRLAVPLIALGQIQELDDKLTPLFGQSDWFMGLQKTPMGQVKTVDTTKFVMPERFKEENNYQYVISINGLSWGLAVDSIDQPISIDPDSIRWRSKRDSRPWMAGMVKDHMCVLLDIPLMGEILEKEDKNHSKTTGG
jgi:purine-binding chemotaxis protein CheW